MSEYLSSERREQIRDEVNEEFDMTRLKMELYLRAYGVDFLETDIPLGQTEAPQPHDFMDSVRETVCEQHEKLDRDLTEGEMMMVMEFHYRRVRSDTHRIQRQAENSLAMVRLTMGIIGYHSALRAGKATEVARIQRSLYAFVEANNLPEVWRYMLDAEFGRY